MEKKSNKKSEAMGKLMFVLNEAYKYSKMVFYTLFCDLKLYLWGISSGKCRFYGNTLFQKIPNSTIVIGNNCEFRSSHDSNQIGVYSPCMISTIKTDAKLCIGNNLGMTGCVIGCAKSITIGNNVRIGANALITDTDWHSEDCRTSPDKPVVIEDNVWIGYGAKVLKGVTIGENSVIGLGSIVTRDIPANCIAAGNPCKVIKYLENK